jgi:Mg-chelatase subunit ChlD
MISKPVSTTGEDLCNKIGKLKEKGRTALGPALLTAVTMAGEGSPGSMVIVCTDGLANVGLGSF